MQNFENESSGIEKDARKQWDALSAELKEIINDALNLAGVPFDFPEQLDNLREDFDGDGPNITPEREEEIAKLLKELDEMEGDFSQKRKWAKDNLAPSLDFQ